MIYEYPGTWTSSRCDIVVNDNIVIATELADNPGASITNSAAELATAIVKDFDILPVDLVLIEHYGHESYHGGHGNMDTYDMVEFTWNGLQFMFPRWRPLCSEELRKYLKGWA